MNTQRTPPRGSAQSAERTNQDLSFSPSAFTLARFGSGSRSTEGSGASAFGSGFFSQGSESSGRRRPSGESPGTRKHCPPRNSHALVRHFFSPGFFATGSAHPTGFSSPPSNSLRRRSRSSSSLSFESSGSTFTGSFRSRQR